LPVFALITVVIDKFVISVCRVLHCHRYLRFMLWLDFQRWVPQK